MTSNIDEDFMMQNKKKLDDLNLKILSLKYKFDGDLNKISPRIKKIDCFQKTVPKK